jgi:uncharacterized membrane protein
MSLEPLLSAPPVIQVHALFAFMALLIGAVQLTRKKGDWLHRVMGKTWVVFMAVVAGSSFFIWTIRVVWLFSPIHLISIFTLVMLWVGVRAAQRGDIKRRMRTMEYLYFLALVVTGLLTFIPGRIMYKVAFGPEGATPAKLMMFSGIVLVAAAIALGIAVWRRRNVPKLAALAKSSQP